MRTRHQRGAPETNGLLRRHEQIAIVRNRGPLIHSPSLFKGTTGDSGDLKVVKKLLILGSLVQKYQEWTLMDSVPARCLILCDVENYGKLT